MKVIPTIFEDREIRHLYDEKTETWFFSGVDIFQILTHQPDFQTARKYWNKLKGRKSVGDKLSPTEIARRRRQELHEQT